MSKAGSMPHYSPAEDMFNVSSHAMGFVLSFIASIALIERAITVGNVLYLISVIIFGFSLLFLYGASTIYHSTKDIVRRGRRRILDHASIYVLIAGTYTPFTLITLQGTTGWVIFSVSWIMALTGIILKFFFTGKYRLLSTLMYLFMGWLILFAIGPLIEKLPSQGLNWLVVGGIAYTLGAVLYSIKKIPFNHAIFHVFVLLGSSCHFVAIYFYLV
jgi:hemolysin III